jgi:hypothetical protein
MEYHSFVGYVVRARAQSVCCFLQSEVSGVVCISIPVRYYIMYDSLVMNVVLYQTLQPKIGPVNMCQNRKP